MTVYFLSLAALALAGVIVLIARAERRPGSLTARYRADLAALRAPASSAGEPLVTEADLASLPPAISRYVRRAGVVGRPRVRSVHSVFLARMRNGRDAPWMSATVEQWDFIAPNARLFLMKAKQSGIPFTAYHRYVGDAATFEVRLAGLLPIIRVSGPTMTRSETVTLFNDLCILAPAALIDPAITWTVLDPTRVRGEFTNAGHRISAVLTFDESGDLVNFRSDDRHQNDGKRDRLLPWLTPVSDYRDFDGVRLAAVGEARWLEPDGEWTYGRFELQRIAFNEDRPTPVMAPRQGG